MMNGDDRVEQLLGQLHRWAMLAIEEARDDRDAYIRRVADRYHGDALQNGLTEAQAEEWRTSVAGWLRELVDVIETSGGAGGGHA
jgi:hypothetical protein